VRTLRFAVALLALGLGPASVAAQQGAAAGEIRVAVFPMTGFMIGEDNKALATAFRNMIGTELGLSGRLKVMERQELDELLRAQNIAVSGVVSDDDAVRIGRLIGVQYAVTGSVTMDSREARLDLRMIDVETSETVTRPFKEQLPKDQLLGLVARVATDFAGNARVSARVADVVVPPAAQLAYVRGLDYETRGQKEQAAGMFRSALELFPQHPHARAALERVN
jgi:TolB-like protein